MDMHGTDSSQEAKGAVKLTGWKRSLRTFLLIAITLVGLWSIIATGGGSSGGGGSSSSGGTVSGSGT